jgi:hypothetical protein
VFASLLLGEGGNFFSLFRLINTKEFTMKKVTSLVGQKQSIDALASDLASDLRSLGFSKSAVIIASASSALSEHDAEAEVDIDEDIEDALDETSGSDDSDTEEDIEDSLDDSDSYSDEDEDAEEDMDVAVSSAKSYSKEELRKLRHIATSCVEDGRHVKAAKQLLRSIDAYEGSGR